MRIAFPSLLFVALATPAITGDEPLIVVTRPTVVAFFPPVSGEELAKDPDTNEALADFQFYASRVREPLGTAGVDFQEVYVYSFQVRRGKRLTTFRPKQVAVGYLFVSPQMKPSVEYGVMTDRDLFEFVHKYFGIMPK